MRIMMIGVAGALGTMARYRIEVLLRGRVSGPWPIGTLVVNLVGSFALAVLMRLLLGTRSSDDDLRLVLGVGLLGGFTTYSSFSFETLRFFQNGAWGQGIVYALVSVIGGIVAALAGWLAASAAMPT